MERFKRVIYLIYLRLIKMKLMIEKIRNLKQLVVLLSKLEETEFQFSYCSPKKSITKNLARLFEVNFNPLVAYVRGLDGVEKLLYESKPIPHEAMVKKLMINAETEREDLANLAEYNFLALKQGHELFPVTPWRKSVR